MKNILIREYFKELKIPFHIYLNHIFSHYKENNNYIQSYITFKVRSKF
jgi:hypothetical protein